MSIKNILKGLVSSNKKRSIKTKTASSIYPPKRASGIDVYINGNKQRVEYNPNISEAQLSKIESDIEEKLQASRERNKLWERHFGIVMEYANNGREFERQGKPEAAINEYRQAVDYAIAQPDFLGYANYAHSLERLAVLYRKMRLYENEIDICNIIIDKAYSDKDKELYQLRKDKATQLRDKQNG